MMWSSLAFLKLLFDSCDAICKTMDHAGDADLLFSPEFFIVHAIDMGNFPPHRNCL
jgi:hypothetical protein